jgi:hypothetical protein
MPGPSVTLLPRRNPGTSGITDVPASPAEQLPRRNRRGLATPWWENGQGSAQTPPQQSLEPSRASTQTPTQAPAGPDTSAFFAARSKSAGDRARETPAAEPAGPPARASISPISAVPKGPTPPAAPIDDDVIYRRMLSELLGDPYDLADSPDLDWQSVWDRGWSLAAAAEDKPVELRTAKHGLPVREPGARLVPGAANGTDLDELDDELGAGDEGPADEGQGSLVGSNGGSPSGRPPQHAAVARDPESVRASFSNHFGGVRTARSHARHTNEGSDQE